MAPFQNPFFARLFQRIGDRNEARGQAELRRELLAGLTGTVVEVGAGTGLNFPHYPDEVTKVAAVEPEPSLRSAARRAATHAPVPVSLVAATAGRLPFEDGSADAVVVSGVLCSVADPPAALAEFARILAPGGELRFYEHVRSPVALRALIQDAADLVWPRLMGGCHPNRDALAVMRAAGWQPVRWRELIFPDGAKVSVVAPRVLGVARPASAPGEGGPG
ncbi:class I SAM-dependent methyltransferase [Saccharomonospora sp. NPDC006951]